MATLRIPWAVSMALGLAAASAQASLTPIGNESFASLVTGGAMAVIQLDGTESGGARLLSNGTPAAAPSNTLSFQTFTLAQLGLTNAADFRLLVSPQETDNVLSSTSIGVQFFSPTGTILYTATTNQRFDLDTTSVSGQGFVFGLDSEQAAEAQAAAFGNPANVVGVFGTFVDSTGGPETLLGTARLSPPGEGGGGGTPGEGGGGPVSPVPEPDTWALLLAGLGVLAAARRLRRG